MENSNWKGTREIISKILKVDERLIDIISLQTMLLKCVSGISNEKIAYFEDTLPEYVSKSLYEFLGFNGWSIDLDVNPWMIYKSCYGNKECYIAKVQVLTKLLNYDIIDLSYRVCRIYDSIRKELDKFYSRDKI